jgi:N-methylhydantoinase B
MCPVEDCLIGALAEVLPDKVVSESALMQLINLSGTDENGNPFVTVNSAIGPFPARAHKDGESAVLFPSNAKVSPIEIFEQYCPLRIRRSKLVKDTEGAGEHIPGFAHGVSFYNPTENVIDVSLTSSKDRKAPSGVQGGEPGTCAAARFLDSDKEAPTSGRTEIHPGETFAVHSATPGGYGSPRDRDSEAVMRDYTLDLISKQRCRDTYRVDPSKQAD